VKAASRLEDRLVGPVQPMDEENPSLGHRTVAFLPGFHMNIAPRLFPMQGWAALAGR